MSETGPQANWLLHGAAPSGHLPVWCRTRHVAARSAALNDSARLHQLMREGSPELPKYRHSAQMRQPLVLLLLLTSRLPASGDAPQALSLG